MRTRMIGAAAASLLLSSIAQAAEIKLLASAAIKEAYLELIPEFEKTTGNKVMAQWAGTPDIQKRIAGGEAADVVILGSSGADELIRQGKLVAGSRANFVKSGIGVAVRDGAPRPDISSADAVLAAKAVA
jgi:molybdate transport system substrate-binding protein